MANFPPLPFDELNEADVREEILAPLLRALGYRSGTDANVIREQSLRYPRIFLGRKDAAKDPELRSKADYILEVKRLVRWVIEAKAPSAAISDQERGYQGRVTIYYGLSKYGPEARDTIA